MLITTPSRWCEFSSYLLAELWQSKFLANYLKSKSCSNVSKTNQSYPLWQIKSNICIVICKSQSNQNFLLALAYTLIEQNWNTKWEQVCKLWRHQRSQIKLEASQRTLAVCRSCGTLLPTIHITCDESSW